MTGKSFRGKDDCYVCGSELHWHCPAAPDTAGNAAISPAGEEIPAAMTAIGKDDDGTVLPGLLLILSVIYPFSPRDCLSISSMTIS